MDEAALESEDVKRTFSIKRFLDTGSWAALFILTPLFFIALLSQNSLPGDFLYPVKRGIENSFLAAASVNPTRKAFIHTDLADRRFSEAEKLLLSQADTAPLNDLVTQVQSTEAAISAADPAKQEELTTKVIAQIDSYQAKLTNTAQQIHNNPAPFSTTATQSQQALPTQVVTSTKTVTPTPSAPASTIPTATEVPNQTAPEASVTVGTAEVEEQKRQVEQAVEITKQKLEKVKKDLEEKKKQREERIEERQLQNEREKDKREEKIKENHQESENPLKEDKNTH